jgi:hypothetical protein
VPCLSVTLPGCLSIGSGYGCGGGDSRGDVGNVGADVAAIFGIRVSPSDNRRSASIIPFVRSTKGVPTMKYQANTLHILYTNGDVFLRNYGPEDMREMIADITELSTDILVKAVTMYHTSR